MTAVIIMAAVALCALATATLVFLTRDAVMALTRDTGHHAAPRVPLRLRAWQRIRIAVAVAAVYASAYALAAFYSAFRLRAPASPGGADNGDLPSALREVPAATGAPTVTDVAGLAIAGGSDVRAQVTA